MEKVRQGGGSSWAPWRRGCSEERRALLQSRALLPQLPREAVMRCGTGSLMPLAQVTNTERWGRKGVRSTFLPCFAFSQVNASGPGHSLRGCSAARGHFPRAALTWLKGRDRRAAPNPRREPVPAAHAPPRPQTPARRKWWDRFPLWVGPQAVGQSSACIVRSCPIGARKSV